MVINNRQRLRAVGLAAREDIFSNFKRESNGVWLVSYSSARAESLKSIQG